MNDFIEAVISSLAGKISDDALDRVTAALDLGKAAHKKAVMKLLGRIQKDSYSDGYNAGYRAGHTEGWTEGEENGFYEAQQQMQSNWRDQ